MSALETGHEFGVLVSRTGAVHGQRGVANQFQLSVSHILYNIYVYIYSSVPPAYIERGWDLVNGC